MVNEKKKELMKAFSLLTLKYDINPNNRWGKSAGYIVMTKALAKTVFCRCVSICKIPDTSQTVGAFRGGCQQSSWRDVRIDFKNTVEIIRTMHCTSYWLYLEILIIIKSYIIFKRLSWPFKKCVFCLSTFTNLFWLV